MQAQQAPMIFTEAERQTGDRLLKLALETDRVEGYTEPHAVMIARLVETIGQQMGLHGTDLSALKFAALAHDIGERGMKRNYLLSPNVLTWEERLDLWRHPILGEQAAAEIKLSRQTQLLVRWHHEWWNGQGYPDGLSGNEIPLGARILRAADSYCALICQRPYRQAFDLAEAEQVIADLAGIEFDPQVAKQLLAVVSEERRQREAELERQRQEAALWAVPPDFVTEPQRHSAQQLSAQQLSAQQFSESYEEVQSESLTVVTHEIVEESVQASVETGAQELFDQTTTNEPAETSPAVTAESLESAALEQAGEIAPATDVAEQITGEVLADQAPTAEFPAVESPENSIQTPNEPTKPVAETEAAVKIQN